MLDYRIYTFLTLYREMNYRKTADILNITQPGVTQHIQFMENHYGIKLFTYDGRTLKRTHNADILHKFLSRTVAEENALPEQFHKQTKIQLRVGATKTIGEFVLLPVVEKFISAPDHSLNLTIDNTQTLLSMLDDRKLDFALVEGAFDKNKYDYQLFRRERVVGICAKNHPFAGRQVSLEELFSQTLFVREIGSGTRGIIEQLLSENGYTLENFSRTISINNFTAIQKFVSDDIGITFAYLPVALANDSLATFEIENCPIQREFNYVFLNELVAIPKIQQFLLCEKQNHPVFF